jgi:hypothetical protein
MALAPDHERRELRVAGLTADVVDVEREQRAPDHQQGDQRGDDDAPHPEGAEYDLEAFHGAGTSIRGLDTSG